MKPHLHIFRHSLASWTDVVEEEANQQFAQVSSYRHKAHLHTLLSLAHLLMVPRIPMALVFECVHCLTHYYKKGKHTLVVVSACPRSGMSLLVSELYS